MVEYGIAYVERPVVEESAVIVEGEKHSRRSKRRTWERLPFLPSHLTRLPKTRGCLSPDDAHISAQAKAASESNDKPLKSMMPPSSKTLLRRCSSKRPSSTPAYQSCRVWKGGQGKDERRR